MQKPIYQESSHIIPTNVYKGFVNSLSACISTNLPEKWQTVSDCGIRFAFPSPERQHRKSRLQTPEEFPPTRSRVVMRLAGDTKAKPNANTRTLRPDKCLVVSSLAPGLRPFHPRNPGANAVTTRIIYARPTIAVLYTLAPATQDHHPKSER